MNSNLYGRNYFFKLKAQEKEKIFHLKVCYYLFRISLFKMERSFRLSMINEPQDSRAFKFLYIPFTAGDPNNRQLSLFCSVKLKKNPRFLIYPWMTSTLAVSLTRINTSFIIDTIFDYFICLIKQRKTLICVGDHDFNVFFI